MFRFPPPPPRFATCCTHPPPDLQKEETYNSNPPPTVATRRPATTSATYNTTNTRVSSRPKSELEGRVKRRNNNKKNIDGSINRQPFSGDTISHNAGTATLRVIRGRFLTPLPPKKDHEGGNRRQKIQCKLPPSALQKLNSKHRYRSGSHFRPDTLRNVRAQSVPPSGQN